jgi:hypothetical protein
MRTLLADKLLARIMEWTPEEIDQERPLLQAMANLKWNEYQQFSPGTRFLESLIKWLKQFENLEDRKTGYRLVKEHLIFISSEQLAHLVDILFSEKVNPILIKKTAREMGISPYLVTKILRDISYSQNLRMSLFIGLSDGSRIDQFRRGASLNNEQVIPQYSVSDIKVKDLIEKLQQEIPRSKFKTLFLIDDFTASGKTYCRDDGGGKLGKIFNTVFKPDQSFYSAVDHENIEIHVFFYIATAEALENVRKGIEAWKMKNNLEFTCTVECLLLIDGSVKTRIVSDREMMLFLEKYFDSSVVDKHYQEGKHDLPFLGFNECCLPIVLNHNSPNNSVAILWMPTDKRYRGLFPRISRHRENKYED